MGRQNLKFVGSTRTKSFILYTYPIEVKDN